MQIKSVAVGAAGGLPAARLALDLGLDYAGSDWQLRDPDAGADWEHNVPADQLWWDNYVVQAGSLAEARSFLPLFRSEGRAKLFVLVIRGFFPAEEQPAWTPRSLQHKAGTAALTVPGLGLAVTVTGGKWVTVHSAALAALGCATPVPVPAALGGLRVGFADTTDREWLAGDARGSFMTGGSASAGGRRHLPGGRGDRPGRTFPVPRGAARRASRTCHPAGLDALRLGAAAGRYCRRLSNGVRPVRGQTNQNPAARRPPPGREAGRSGPRVPPAAPIPLY